MERVLVRVSPWNSYHTSYVVFYSGRVVSLHQIEKYLETYSLDEILELNEMTESEVLEFLVNEEFVFLPNPSPVDLDD